MDKKKLKKGFKKYKRWWRKFDYLEYLESLEDEEGYVFGDKEIIEMRNEISEGRL